MTAATIGGVIAAVPTPFIANSTVDTDASLNMAVGAWRKDAMVSMCWE